MSNDNASVAALCRQLLSEIDPGQVTMIVPVATLKLICESFVGVATTLNRAAAPKGYTAAESGAETVRKQMTAVQAALDHQDKAPPPGGYPGKAGPPRGLGGFAFQPGEKARPA